MAECHPVGFQWVMEAKARGAKVFHIDPRFTRTSAVARRARPDPGRQRHRPARRARQPRAERRHGLPRVRHSPTPTPRPSSARTSATPRTSTGSSPATTPRSGRTTRPAGRTRARIRRRRPASRDEAASRTTGPTSTGRAATLRGDPVARPGTPRPRDDTLAGPALRLPGAEAPLRPLHPGDWSRRCAASPRRRSPGSPTRSSRNSGRERTDRVRLRGRLDPAHGRRAVHPHRRDPAAAAGQHRPAGRRHPRAARARQHPGLDRHPHAVQPAAGLPADAVRARARGPRHLPGGRGRRHRLLGQQARLHGEPAQGVVGRRRDRGERLLLRLPAAADRRPRHLPHRHGPDRRARSRATSSWGRTRRSARPAARLQRQGLAASSTGWWSATSRSSRARSSGRTARRSPPARLRTEDIATEVFFLPAAAHVEKDGTFTNTQRLLQWHHKALEPPGDCRSDLWFYYHLGRASGAAGRLHRRARPAGPRPDLGLPGRGRARTTRPRTPCCARSTATAPTARRWPAYTELKADGSTSCGCWIYSGVYADEVNQAARRRPGPGADLGRARMGLGLAGQPPHPLQPRLGRPEGRPWSERKAYVWWDAERGSGPATTSRTSSGQAARLRAAARTPRPRPRSAAPTRSSCSPTARAGCSRRAGLVDGPLPTHYEPHESPVGNPLYGQQANPARQVYPRPDNRVPPARGGTRSSRTSSRPTGSPSTTRRAG